MAPSQARIDHVNETANRLYGGDAYMRIVLYGREASLDCRGDVKASPRMITPFLVGRGGYGKTSKLRQLSRDLGIGYIERKLGGIIDIAEVFGGVDFVKDPDRVGDDGKIIYGKVKTVMAAPEWWPDPENDPNCPPVGNLVWDDITRCTPHILNSVMQPLIDGEINGLVLPEGWTMSCTGNPEGEYNVQTMDGAQWSRFLVVPYNRPNEVFYEQLELQGVDDDLKNVWMNASEGEVDIEPLDLPKPPNNDRTKMIFARIYPYLKNDEAALQIVAKGMFEPRFLTALHAMRQKDRPLQPEMILDDWHLWKGTFERYVSEQRTDLMNITVIRMLTHLSVTDESMLKDEAYANLAEFGALLPASEAKNFVKRLAGASADLRYEGHARRLKRSTLATGNTFVKQVRETDDRLTRRLAERAS